MKLDNPEEGEIIPPPNPNPYPYPDNNTSVNNSWGALADIVKNILQFIDTPWKVITIIILVFIGWFGLVSYQNIDYLKKVYDKKNSQPHIIMDKAEENLKLIMRQSGANAIILYNVEPALNRKAVIYAIDQNGRDKNIEGNIMGIFSSNKENNKYVAQIISNEIVCLVEDVPVNAASLWFDEKGSKYICMASLPVDTYEYTAQITIGFKEKPEDIDKVKSIMKIVGTELMTIN